MAQNGTDPGNVGLSWAKFDKFKARETARSRTEVMPSVRQAEWAVWREVFNGVRRCLRWTTMAQ